jgi:hypothetical protein
MQETAPATVQVLRGGVPVDGCLVVLHPVTPCPGSLRPVSPSGMTKADGTATLVSYMAGDGAPEGDYVVTLLWRPVLGKEGDEVLYGPDKFAGRFAAAANSPLRCRVKKGEAAPIRIDANN